MSDENQAEYELLNPAFGDWQVEEYVVTCLLAGRSVGRFGVEGVVECFLCDGLLLVNELSADVEFGGQLGDGCGAGQSLYGQCLALVGVKGFGGAWLRVVRVGGGG